VRGHFILSLLLGKANKKEQHLSLFSINMLKLTLNDPIMAESQTLDLLMRHNSANYREKQKIQRTLQAAIKKAQASNNTYVASVYRAAYNTLKGTNQ